MSGTRRAIASWRYSTSSSSEASPPRNNIFALLSSPIIIVVITGMMTTLTNTYTTQISNAATYRQKELEQKIDTFGNVTAELAKYRRVRQAYIRYHIAVAMHKRVQAPKTLRDELEAAKLVQALIPGDFARGSTIDDEIPLVHKQLSLAEFYFGPNTQEAARELERLLPAHPDLLLLDFADRYPNAVSRDESKAIVNAPIDGVAEFSDRHLESATKKLLDAMRTELSRRYGR